MQSITLDIESFEFGVYLFIVVWFGIGVLELMYALINYFTRRELFLELHKTVKHFVEAYNENYAGHGTCFYNYVSYHESLLMMEMMEYFGYEMCSDGKIRRFSKWEKFKRSFKRTIRNNQEHKRIDA